MANFTLRDIYPKEKCKFKFEFEPKYKIGELVTCCAGEEHKHIEYLTLKIIGYELEVSDGFSSDIEICYYAAKIGKALPSPDAEDCFFSKTDNCYFIVDSEPYNWDKGNFYVREDNKEWGKI